MFGIPVRGLIVIGVLVAAGLMYAVNGGKPMGSADASTECRMTVTADVLNVRYGPAETQPIVSTMQRDAVTRAERKVENGFRMLDTGRWVNEEFVAPTSDSECAPT
ncbi:SH3 domain-containing protein [Umezawaea sp. Da 62-37]|uniref:SH3 domain-containing protein n=1 Tax=Umezawaea sp. Da 62-37 TaxID=3075927 RepID=UPI0028F6C26D|nr:SH3 domain-containing protein [Umezawaea sp. Da 62-37]WNV90736.1 SH3 domain-containing protein [Umezawaea sp. Da 62-37]